MTVSTLALALAYVFLLFVLLLAIFRSDIAVGIKLTLTALSLGFYIWHYNVLQDFFGWPAQQGLPANFELIGSYTVEPDLKNDEAGGIYIWIRDLDGGALVPRAFQLPYRKQLHQQVNDTLQQQQQGERFVGKPRGGGSGNKVEIEFESIKRHRDSHKLDSTAQDG